MHTVTVLISFAYGMSAMWGFMRTKYAYPNISRGFYLLDTASALILLGVAYFLTS